MIQKLQRSKFLSVIGLSLFLLSTSLEPTEITVIKDPKPTFTEKKFVTLERVNQTRDSDDSDDFLAFPSGMAADHQGNLYVFDTARVKILKFNRQLDFVKSYGRKGRGPGDFAVPARYVSVDLYCNDVNLYVLNPLYSQLIVMDLDLNYLDEFRLDLEEDYINSRFAVNKAGHFVLYSPTGTGNILMLDHEMKLKSKFSFDIKWFEFLFFQPPMCLIENRSNRLKVSLAHDTLRDSRLLVYSFDTSTLLIFRDNKLEDRFNLYSQKILDQYKPLLKRALKEVSRARKKRKGRVRVPCGYLSPFVNFFVDKDTENSFYLEYRDVTEKMIYLYQFNLKGKFLKVYRFKEDTMYLNRMEFRIKRNKQFYALESQSTIVTYMEK